VVINNINNFNKWTKKQKNVSLFTDTDSG